MLYGGEVTVGERGGEGGEGGGGLIALAETTVLHTLMVYPQQGPLCSSVRSVQEDHTYLEKLNNNLKKQKHFLNHDNRVHFSFVTTV